MRMSWGQDDDERKGFDVADTPCRRDKTLLNAEKCDFCHEVATYDGKTLLGPWANMCETCFDFFGVGLSLGRGQKLREDGCDDV